ncbi:hypothetical protein GBAR_LOCUS28998 [Geodia barretti]|nr:hypothetical protein GBAR_LOCUS28998 [Geodia barretti]
MVHQIVAQQPQGNDNQKDSNTKIMEWSIPIVALVLAFIIITGVIAYTVYRQKKYGAFCCLMPKMRYRVGTSEETIERQDYPSPPPSYDMSRRHIIAPPEYHDALQDVLLESGNSSNTGQTGSRLTSWSNIAMNISTPPEYAAVVTSTVLNTTETLHQDSEAEHDTSRDTDSSSNATMSLSNILEEQITGGELISPRLSSTSADTESEQTRTLID